MANLAFFSVFLLFLASATLGQKRYEPNWASLDSRPLPGWFDKAKVGIFLHWGIYSVPSYHNEWFVHNWHSDEANSDQGKFMRKFYPSTFKYEDFAHQFKAEFFNPNEWAELFKKAGAKYVVLTAKHHEGYTMWPSKHSPGWNAGEVGPHRDLVGDLAQAIRTHNLTFGLYHSLLEWYHPLYQKDQANKWKTHEFVTTKVRPCLEELINTYKPSILWSDGEWEQEDTYWNSTDFLAWLYNDSPVKDIVVTNDRWGSNTKCKHGGFLNCDDRFTPSTVQSKKFETCMTLDYGSWGYRREASLHEFMNMHDLLKQFLKTISYGGNILINVGPTSWGKIPPVFESRLLELGEWLQVNGEAIYESHPWIHQEDSVTKELWYTQKTGHVYGIVLGYHPQIEFGSVKFDQVKQGSVRLLGLGEQNIPFERAAGDHVLIHMPVLTPLSLPKQAYVFRFEMK